jgi:hypothetical protein
MSLTRNLARILGPALIAIAVTEGVNLDAFAGNPAPVVYLDGTLLFIAGLAIVQAHNIWTRGRSVLVTVTGWTCALAGLYRMAAPQAPQLDGGPAVDAVFALIIAAGAILSWQGYGPRPKAGPGAGD